MRNTIAVMNTKGGVGKSTLVLAMAETLSAKFAKNVLVIDADAQASVSLMLVSPGTLHQLQLDGLTIVDLLVATVPTGTNHLRLCARYSPADHPPSITRDAPVTQRASSDTR